MVAIQSGRITVGEMMGPAFRVLMRNIVPFGIIAILITGVPNALLPFLILGTLPGPDGLPDVAAGESMMSAGFVIVILLTQLVLPYFLTAALIYGSIQDLRGEKVSIGDCLRRALAVLIPVIGLAILVGLLVGIGFILLIVPGLFLFVMYFVAMPVAVVERPGVFASLGRSAELTKGHRWPMLFVFILMIAIAFAITFVESFVLEVFSSLGYPVTLVVDAVVQSFLAAWFAIIPAVAYFNLRYVKEGVDINEIAAVFD